MSAGSPTHSFRGRLTALGLCLAVGLAVIVVQLIRYQVFQHEDLAQKAEAERAMRKELPARRGSIRDAKGNLLALDVTEWDIAADPPYVTDRKAAAHDLAILLGMPEAELLADLSARGIPWLSLKRGVSQEIGQAIADLGANGIECIPKTRRVYPAGELAAHLLGFVNFEGDGFYGVEGYYDERLRGRTGIAEVEKDPFSDELPLQPRTVQPPQDGETLVLTLDLNIQYFVQQELQRALQKYRAEQGTALVMDPRTGALLAAASLPSYDPNRFAEATGPLSDPAVSGQWEPGSVLKIITWAAGLDSGTIRGNTTMADPGKLTVGEQPIVNSDRRAHGTVTMTDALVHSLNTIAALISTKMGKEDFYAYLQRSGFGSLTGVDLQGEIPGTMKVPGDSDWSVSDLGTNSFGQGIAVTPMQMVAAVAAVANGGTLMQPYVVQQFVTEDGYGHILKETENAPKVVRRVISSEAADTLTKMLVQVVQRETTEAQVPGYRIAGKTGTAQIPIPGGYDSRRTSVSFIGYAPADDPQFIILVKLDEPRTSQWADQTAAPTFQAIARRLFTYLEIPPDSIRLAQR